MIIHENKLIFFDNHYNLYEIPFTQEKHSEFFCNKLHDIREIKFHCQDIQPNNKDVQKVPISYYKITHKIKD